MTLYRTDCRHFLGYRLCRFRGMCHGEPFHRYGFRRATPESPASR